MPSSSLASNKKGRVSRTICVDHLGRSRFLFFMSAPVLKSQSWVGRESKKYGAVKRANSIGEYGVGVRVGVGDKCQ